MMSGSLFPARVNKEPHQSDIVAWVEVQRPAQLGQRIIGATQRHHVGACGKSNLGRVRHLELEGFCLFQCAFSIPVGILSFCYRK